MSMMKTKGGEIVHDFRKNLLGYGWNILEFRDEGDKHLTMVGVGLGIKEGHFILMDHGDRAVFHEVYFIKYDSNPKDYFNLKMNGSWFFRKELFED